MSRCRRSAARSLRPRVENPCRKRPSLPSRSPSNSSDEPATLGSIDIYDSLLDGFELVLSRPAFVGVEDVLDFQTLWYQTELQPDAPQTFTLTFRASRSGRHNAGIAA